MLIFLKYILLIALLLFTGFGPYGAKAAVDWEVAGAVQLEETPLDVARAQGDRLTYLLTDQAKVLIYSDTGKLIGTVPVDPSVTGIAVSPKGEQLYLIDNKRKTLKAIDIRFIVDFRTEDSPFLGPADAKIVVAVFSDFQ